MEITLEVYITHRHIEVRSEWRLIWGLAGSHPDHFGLYHTRTCNLGWVLNTSLVTNTVTLRTHGPQKAEPGFDSNHTLAP